MALDRHELLCPEPSETPDKLVSLPEPHDFHVQRKHYQLLIIRQVMQENVAEF